MSVESRAQRRRPQTLRGLPRTAPCGGEKRSATSLNFFCSPPLGTRHEASRAALKEKIPSWFPRSFSLAEPTPQQRAKVEGRPRRRRCRSADCSIRWRRILRHHALHLLADAAVDEPRELIDGIV